MADTPTEGARAEGGTTTAEPIIPVTGSVQAEVEPSLGEGPSAVAGPPVEEAPMAPFPTPAALEPTEAVEGGEVEAIPSRPSMMNHGRWTEWLIAQLIMPEFQEELSQLGASAFFREAFVALVQLSILRDFSFWYPIGFVLTYFLMQSANSLVATREVINQGETILREAQREAAGARARAKRAEEAMEVIERRAAAEAEHAQAALDQLGEAMGAVTARDYRIHALTVEVKVAEERAENAEEVARWSDSRVAEGEAKVHEAEAAAAAAEERAAAAERRAAEVVDNFRKSTSFTNELAEASMEVYLQGFRDYREKVARVLGLPNVMDIEPDEVSEEAPSEDGPAAVNP